MDTYNKIILIITTLTAIVLHSSEIPSLLPIHRHTAEPVLASQNHSKNTINKILIAPDDNDHVFVCYAGYGIIKKWKSSVNKNKYKLKPVYNRHTNILVEIDVRTKLEYELKLKETPNITNPIDNELPVIDIARHKDNYIIAHNNNMLVCKKINSSTLSTAQKLCNFLTKNATIKKLYVNHNNQLLIISSKGSIHSHDLTGDKPVNCIYTMDKSLFKNNELLATTYSPEHNLVLFGLRGAMHIIFLNNDKPTAEKISFKPNFYINTIDICSTHILISNIIPPSSFPIKKRRNRNGSINYHKGQCCINNLQPSDMHDCDDCSEKLKQYKTQKMTLEGTIKEIAKNVQEYQTKKPVCTHKIPNEPSLQHLPDSCTEQTLYLLTLSNILQQTNAAPVYSGDLGKKTEPWYDRHRKISSLALINNFLLVTCGGKNIHLYKIPLKDIALNNLNKQLKGENLFDYSTCDNINYEYPKDIHKNCLITKHRTQGSTEVITLIFNTVPNYGKDDDYPRYCANPIVDMNQFSQEIIENDPTIIDKTKVWFKRYFFSRQISGVIFDILSIPVIACLSPFVFICHNPEISFVAFLFFIAYNLK